MWTLLGPGLTTDRNKRRVETDVSWRMTGAENGQSRAAVLMCAHFHERDRTKASWSCWRHSLFEGRLPLLNAQAQFPCRGRSTFVSGAEVLRPLRVVRAASYNLSGRLEGDSLDRRLVGVQDYGKLDRRGYQDSVESENLREAGGWRIRGGLLPVDLWWWL
jgi:hypothetical protein